MKTFNPNAILDKYNETDRKFLEKQIRLLAFIGVGEAPKTDEEFSKFCKDTINDRNTKKAKADAKKDAMKKARLLKEAGEAYNMDMSIEIYRQYKAIKSKYTRLSNKIENLEKELAKEQRKLARYEEQLNQYK